MNMQQSSSSNTFFYEDELEENDENLEPSTPKRRRVQYEESARFANNDEFTKWLEEEDVWTRSKVWDVTGTTFRMQYFYCRHWKRAAKCPALLKADIHKTTGEVIVARAREHSNHGPSELTTFVKQFMRDQLKQKKKPAQIRDELLRVHQTAPLMSQVQNFAAHENRKTGLHKPISVEELRQHCNDNAVPNDAHSPFVLAHRIQSAEEVVIVWTTPHLIDAQRDWTTICVDGTYKTISLNWPVMKAGFTDANRRFYSTAIALSAKEDAPAYSFFFEAIRGAQAAYHPTVLMADSALGITAAQQDVWPNTNRTTCWFHVKKALKERFKSKPLADYADEVFRDVTTLSQSGTFAEFIKAARVLNNHWAVRFANQTDVREALASFVDFYVRNDNNNGWFAGDWPRTNNSLESANRQFKDRATDHRRVPVREFLELAADQMRISSLSPDHRSPVLRPHISLDVYKAAHELYKEKRKWLELRNDADMLLYALIPSKAGMDEYGTRDTVRHLEALHNHLHSENDNAHPFESWAQYKEMRGKFHCVKRSRLWPDWYTCSCYVGTKRQPCKHSVLVMQKRGLVEFPAAVTAELLQASRKRGRPKKVRPGTALMRE